MADYRLKLSAFACVIVVMTCGLPLGGCSEDAPAPEAQSPQTPKVPFAQQRETKPATARTLLAQDAQPSAEIAAMKSLPWYYLQAIAVINELHALEQRRGTPTWSQLRTDEERLIDCAVDQFAAVQVINACKTLAYRVWRLASDVGTTNDLKADDLAAVWQARKQHLKADNAATGEMLTAFANNGDSLRTIVAIMTDAIACSGLFEARAVDLKPAKQDGVSGLARVTHELRAALLLGAAGHAKARGSDTVRIEDVHAAFSELAQTLSLTETDVPAREQAQGGHDAVEAGHLLRWLTAYYIDRKLASRAQPQSTEDAHRRIMAALDELTDQTVTVEGYQRWMLRLYAIPRFTSLGIFPRRQDAAASNVGALTEIFDLKKGGVLRRAEQQDPYVSLTDMANIIEQMCPNQKTRSGGMKFYWTLKDIDQGGKYIGAVQSFYPQESQLMHDSGVAWMQLSLAWRTREDTVAADPFAIEYQAERVNDAALLYAKLFDILARREGSAINDTSPDEFMLVTLGLNPMYEPPIPWTPQAQARAQAVKASIPAQPYEDVTTTTGISQELFVEDLSPQHEQTNYELRVYTGSGVGLGDYDGDGLIDMFLGGGAGNRLYRNLGNCRFEDVTQRVGIDDTRVDDTHHTLFGDVNNDGWLDLLIIHGESPARLFIQREDHTFEDVSETCGIRVNPGAHNAFFMDYDNDGLLDVYIGHYGASEASGMEWPSVDARNGNANQLYRNEGQGKFRDVSKAAGVDSGGWTLASAAFDFNRDGLMDFYLANDWGADQLYVSEGVGKYRELGPQLDARDSGSGMNVSLTDLDADGDWDIYVSVIDLVDIPKNAQLYVPAYYDRADLDAQITAARLYLAGNKLLQNVDARGFLAVENERFEPTETGWGWAGLFFDYDNDGDEDMYLTNGWIRREWANMQHNRFFICDGERFYHHEQDSPESFKGNSRGAAAVDLDGDGRLDLVVNNYGIPPRVLRNVSTSDNRWLKVRLQGVRSNRFGIGAEIRAYVGQRMLMRHVSAGSNYLSQDDTTVTFGIGAADAVDRIEVRWPDGTTQTVTGPHEAGQILTIVEAAQRRE